MEWRTWEGTGKTENRGRGSLQPALNTSGSELHQVPGKGDPGMFGIQKDGDVGWVRSTYACTHLQREALLRLGDRGHAQQGCSEPCPRIPRVLFTCKGTSAPSMDPERSPGTRHITHTYTHTRTHTHTHTAVISFLSTGTSHLDQPYKGCP